MRDIKFRGKRPDNGKWIIGWLFQDDDDHLPMIHEGGTLDVWEQVSENTIGQFTGLCDCKGEEIYEGDILQFRDRSICEVLWNDDVSAFCIRFSFEHEPGIVALGLWQGCERNIEVIGNVHDNPTLLEKA